MRRSFRRAWRDSAQVTTFSVTNTGNTVQDFALTSSQAASWPSLFGGTDNFDTTACAQFVESGGTAGLPVGAGHRDVHRRVGRGCVTYGVCGLQHSR